MIRNHITIAIRNLTRNKLFTVIHLAGLAIGLAACILILLYIQEEFRYVNYHTKGHRVFRVLRAGEDGHFRPNRSGALPPEMEQEFPEVEAAARLLDDWWIKVQHGDEVRSIDVALGDPSILEMFDIELLQGNRATVLNRPNTVVITRWVADAFFGEEDPIGKVFGEMVDESFSGEFIVTGVMEDMAPYATVAFDAITAFPSVESPPSFKAFFQTWNGGPFANYIMLREGVDAAQVEAWLPEFAARHLGKEAAAHVQYRLQPINRMRLYSEVDFGMAGTQWQPVGVNDPNPRQPRGIHRIHQLALVGLVILLIACFNFMNLATAQSARRAREVGVRKVLGARRSQLVRQFLVESVVLACAGAILAYVVASMALPEFNTMIQARLKLSIGVSLGVGLICLSAVVGLLAGSYPAFYLSLARPEETLKGGRGSLDGSAAGIRRSLVVVQFAVSSVLVFAAIIVYLQTRHMGKKDLGYDPSFLVNVPVGRYPVETSFEVMRRAFADHPTILSATASRPALGSWGNNGGIRRVVHPEGEAETEWQMQSYGIDEHFLKTYGMELVAGRNLRPRDVDRDALLLNETAVRQLGWKDPIGKRIDLENAMTGYVVGVVKDFHTQSLHNPVAPVVLHHWDQHTITARIHQSDVKGALAYLKETWGRFLPGGIRFEHWYVGRNLAMWYREDIQLRESCTLFSLLAVFVESLGLFGLASFAAEQRTKEIGIRKVLGATVASIAGMFSREFVRLAVIANLVAAPVAFYVMQNWLDNFPYRIGLTPVPFLLCVGATLTIAVLTVSYQSVKAGTADPVEALRNQ